MPRRSARHTSARGGAATMTPTGVPVAVASASSPPPVRAPSPSSASSPPPFYAADLPCFLRHARLDVRYYAALLKHGYGQSLTELKTTPLVTLQAMRMNDDEQRRFMLYQSKLVLRPKKNEHEEKYDHRQIYIEELPKQHGSRDDAATEDEGKEAKATTESSSMLLSPSLPRTGEGEEEELNVACREKQTMPSVIESMDERDPTADSKAADAFKPSSSSAAPITGLVDSVTVQADGAAGRAGETEAKLAQSSDATKGRKVEEGKKEEGDKSRAPQASEMAMPSITADVVNQNVTTEGGDVVTASLDFPLDASTPLRTPSPSLPATFPHPCPPPPRPHPPLSPSAAPLSAARPSPRARRMHQQQQQRQQHAQQSHEPHRSSVGHQRTGVIVAGMPAEAATLTLTATPQSSTPAAMSMTNSDHSVTNNDAALMSHREQSTNRSIAADALAAMRKRKAEIEMAQLSTSSSRPEQAAGQTNIRAQQQKIQLPSAPSHPFEMQPPTQHQPLASLPSMPHQPQPQLHSWPIWQQQQQQQHRQQHAPIQSMRHPIHQPQSQESTSVIPVSASIPSSRVWLCEYCPCTNRQFAPSCSGCHRPRVMRPQNPMWKRTPMRMPPQRQALSLPSRGQRPPPQHAQPPLQPIHSSPLNMHMAATMQSKSPSQPAATASTAVRRAQEMMKMLSVDQAQDRRMNESEKDESMRDLYPTLHGSVIDEVSVSPRRSVKEEEPRSAENIPWSKLRENDMSHSVGSIDDDRVKRGDDEDEEPIKHHVKPHHDYDPESIQCSPLRNVVIPSRSFAFPDQQTNAPPTRSSPSQPRSSLPLPPPAGTGEGGVAVVSFLRASRSRTPQRPRIVAAVSGPCVPGRSIASPNKQHADADTRTHPDLSKYMRKTNEDVRSNMAAAYPPKPPLSRSHKRKNVPSPPNVTVQHSHHQHQRHAPTASASTSMSHSFASLQSDGSGMHMGDGSSVLTPHQRRMQYDRNMREKKKQKK